MFPRLSSADEQQKGEKKTHAYLTCVVAMLLEDTLEGLTPLKTLPVPEADVSEARKDWLERGRC